MQTIASNELRKESCQTSGLRTIAAYSFRWDVACPHLRITSPITAAGVDLVAGSCTQKINEAADADLVLIQREFPPFKEPYQQVLAKARQAGKPIVYETDDLLFELPPEHPCARHYRSLRMDLLRGMLDADAVIASCDELAAEIRPYNANVFVIPNYLDDRIWPLRRYIQDGSSPVTIGYMGTESHGPDLTMIAEVLRELLTKYGAKIHLKLYGLSAPPALGALANVSAQAECIYDYNEFSAFLRSQKIDIFIAPLQDNKFNRCKSSIKFLEYSSLGIPGVYSDVAPYRHVIEHGVNGWLASTSTDWFSHLESLIASAELRQSVGDAALNTVERDWLVTKNAERIREKLSEHIYPSALAASRSGDNSHLASARFIAERAQSWYQEMNDELIQIGQSRSWRLVQAMHGIRVQLTRLKRLITPGFRSRRGSTR